MYNFEVHDNKIPYGIHKAAYEYCLTRRWYTGYRNLPPLDRVPSEEGHEVDPRAATLHRSILRAPFCSHAEHLPLHKPIEALFNALNENVFDGRMVLNGNAEPSPGVHYRKENTKTTQGDAGSQSVKVPFYDSKRPHEFGLWERAIAEQGSIAYMQAIPYESVRQTRVPHRDWAGPSIDNNDNNYSTVIFVANLNWRPEWFAEMMLFEDAHDDIPGAKFENLAYNRKVGVGWPQEIIPNIPGRILVQDGRQLHATRAVGETSPEPAMHINFRVTFKD